MADGAGFGFMSGMMAGQEAADQHSESQIRQQMGTLGMEKTQLDIDQTKLMIQRNEALIKKMHEMNVTAAGGGDLVAQAEQMANFAFAYGRQAADGGLYEEAMNATQKGTNLMDSVAALTNQKIAAEQKRAQLASNLMDHVHDQKSFDDAVMFWQAETGVKSPYAGQRYSPELIQHIKDAAVNALQQSEISKNRAAEASERAGVTEKTAHARAERALADEREFTLEQKRKQGGKPATEAGMTALMKLGTDRYPNADPNTVREALVDAAEDRQKLINSGVSEPRATQQAFNNAINQGKFRNFKEPHRRLGQQTKTADKGGDGTSKQTAKAAPTDASGNIDVDALSGPEYDGKWVTISGRGTYYIKDGEAHEEDPSQRRGVIKR